jgi:hypothetical protein
VWLSGRLTISRTSRRSQRRVTETQTEPSGENPSSGCVSGPIRFRKAAQRCRKGICISSVHTRIYTIDQRRHESWSNSDILLEELYDRRRHLHSRRQRLTFVTKYADFLGRRSKVSKSTCTLPNLGTRPEFHSKLSMKLDHQACPDRSIALLTTTCKLALHESGWQNLRKVGPNVHAILSNRLLKSVEVSVVVGQSTRVILTY